MTDHGLRYEGLIAPCGMNCGACMAYLRKKNSCGGCLGLDSNKPESCRKCSVVICEIRNNQEAGSCFNCDKYPCRRLKQLDKRYRTKYHMSMLENLEMIKSSGMRAFLREENDRWLCPECGAPVSAHRDICFGCGREGVHEKSA